MTINELLEQRASLLAQARALNDKADSESREMTSEEDTQYQTIMTDVRKLNSKVERQRELDAEERREAAADAAAQAAGREVGTESPENRSDVDLRMDGFRAWAQRGSAMAMQVDGDAFRAYNEWQGPQQRALSMGGGGETGGYLVVPTELAATIIQELDNDVFIRRYATVETLDNAVNLGVPTLESDPGDFEWTTELGTGNEDNQMRFGRRDFNPQPVAKRAKISRTLLHRSSRPVEQVLRDRLFYKLGVTQEKAFLTGDGVGKPLGLFTASNDGIPASRDVSAGNTASAFTFDGLINAKYALTAAFRREARWVFHRDSVSILAKIKDGDGRYIWRVSEREGEPDMLLGHPYDESEYAPNTFTTGLRVGLFGNFRYYWIVDSTLMSILRLEELYAETHQVGFIIRVEADGMPVMANAFARVTLT